MATVAELEFLVRLRDNATSAVNQIKSSFGGLATAAGGASAALGRVQTATAGFGVNVALGAATATQSLNRMAQALAQMVTQHNQAAGGANNHNNAMNNLHHTITRTTAAFADLFAANALASGGLSAFREYEKNMAVVERITENSAAATKDFNARFLDLSRSISAVPIDRLGVIAGQAAQLGIQGNQNILKFTETMGKLETILPELGEQAPKLIARLLAVTGEGIEGVDKFANMLVRAGKDASASEASILHLTSVLAQSTAQFKLGSEVLLGLGTSFAEMGLQPELASTAMSRSLRALNTASLNNTTGMRELTEITGITAEAFQKMIRENPSEAFLIFTDVLRDLNNNGQDTVSFLTQFQLQADETGRVLGTVSQNSEMVRKNIDAMRKEGSKKIAVDQEYGVALKTLDRQIITVQNAWRRTKSAFGEALAPLAISAMKALGAALEALQAGFLKLPVMGQQIVAWGAVAVPAILGVITAFAALRAAMALIGATGLISAFASFGASLVRFTALVTVAAGRFALFAAARLVLAGIATVFGTLVAAVGVIPVAIGVAVAALIAGAAYVYQKWDEVKAFFEGGFVNAITTAFEGAVGKMKGLWDGFLNFLTGSKAPAPEVYGPQLPVDYKAPAVPARQSTVTNDISKVSRLSLEFEKQIAQLDQQSKILDDIKKKEAALDALRNLPATDRNYRSADEQQRLQGLLNIEKLRADSVASRLKTMQEETQTAYAYTQAEKNTLEVVTAVREELEKRGSLTAKQIEDITKSTQALQAARANTAFRGMNDQLKDAAKASQAVTKEQQLQVEIQNKINDAIRTGVITTKEQADAVRNSMQQTAQNNNLKGVMDRVSPQAAAIRDYESDVKTLNEGLKQGSINAEQYNAALAQLNRTTQEARDPWGAQVKSMKEATQLAGILGDYADADRNTQQQINALKEKGVTISKEQATTLQTYNRAMDDVRESQNNGFEGWAKSVGSFRTGLLDVQRSFMSSLSTGIVGVLSGKGKQAVADMFSGLGQKVLTVATDQLLKGLGEQFNVADLFGTGSSEALARAKAANDNAQKQINTNAQSVTVTAASVVVNGQTLTGIGMDSAKTYVTGGQISPYSPAGSPLFTTAPNLTMPTAGTVPGRVRVSLGGQDGFSQAEELIKMKEGFRDKPYWDVNAFRAGYGSDTKTDDSGRVSRIQQGDYVSRADADRDLQRRIGDFQTTVKQQIGFETFDKYGPSAQAALTSTAYNYGKLPSRVVEAVKSGDTNRAADAIQSLGSDNDGINRVRRAEEAELIRSSTQQVQKARETAQQVSQVQTQGAQEQVNAVQTAQSQISSTSQTSGQSMQQLGEKVQEAGNAAQSAAPKMQQVSQQASAVTADSQQMAGGLGSLTGQFASAQLGVGQFGGALSTMLGSLFKSFDSGGGLSGLFGGLFGGGGGGVAAAVAHSGWSVGSGHPQDGYRMLPAGAFANAKRLHTGTNDNEYKAILQKGERVMTENDAKRNDALLSRISAQDMQGGRGAGAGGAQYVNNTFSPGDTNITVQGSSGDKQRDDEYLKNLDAMLAERSDTMMTAWVMNQQRPGNMLAEAGAKRR
jgi:TP901 family phage tail tape measure protein